MKNGDIVKFKDVKEKGDDSLLMIVEEVRGDRCLVRSLVNMAIQPTHAYMTNEMEVVTRCSSRGREHFNDDCKVDLKNG